MISRFSMIGGVQFMFDLRRVYGTTLSGKKTLKISQYYSKSLLGESWCYIEKSSIGPPKLSFKIWKIF